MPKGGGYQLLLRKGKRPIKAGKGLPIQKGEKTREALSRGAQPPDSGKDSVQEKGRIEKKEKGCLPAHVEGKPNMGPEGGK